MAERIPATDLRTRAAELLRRVQDGEAFHITKHNKVIAILTRVEEEPDMGRQPKEQRSEDPAATEPPTSNTHTVRTMAVSTAQQVRPAVDLSSSQFFRPAPKPGKAKEKKR